MEYRTLGKTGLKVSMVGFGGIPIQRIDGANVRTLMEKMIEKGVNYIDTARAYTVSEEYIGNALKGLRHQFIVTTKSTARTYDAMHQEIETSLQNLQTDYIDIYQLHNIKTQQDFDTAFSKEGAATAILDAIKTGKVGHLGATAHSVESFEKLLEYPQVETIMFPYNIVENQGEQLMARAKAQNVGIIAMKPLAGGNITNGTLAMRYILQNENCTLAIPGMATLEEIEENTAVSTAPLTQSEQQEIAQIREELSGDFCRRCGYCAPCTVGIDIPSLFILEGYLKRYDLAGWAKARYEAAPVKASACISCGVCEPRCPYHLNIREKLAAVANAFE